MDKLEQEDITISVTKTDPKFRLTRYGKPIKDIRRICLLGWKAGGTENDPDDTTGVWQNRVLYLHMDYLGTSTPTKGHEIAANSLPKNVHTLNVPTYSVQSTDLVVPGDLWDEFEVPRIISDYPKGDGVVEFISPVLRRNTATLPAVTLEDYTYDELHLTLRFFFAENSKDTPCKCATP
jgi:hypothetical protein